MNGQNQEDFFFTLTLEECTQLTISVESKRGNILPRVFTKRGITVFGTSMANPAACEIAWNLVNVYNAVTEKTTLAPIISNKLLDEVKDLRKRNFTYSSVLSNINLFNKPYITATEFAKVLGITAVELNQSLIKAGWIVKKGSHYLLTDRGEKYGQSKFSDKFDVFYVLWNSETIKNMILKGRFDAYIQPKPLMVGGF